MTAIRDSDPCPVERKGCVARRGCKQTESGYEEVSTYDLPMLSVGGEVLPWKQRKQTASAGGRLQA